MTPMPCATPPTARAFFPLVMRTLVGGVVAMSFGVAQAQGLDPVFFAELRPTASAKRGGPSAFHWWDRDGRYSVAGVRMGLVNGNTVLVTQRLERVANSGDVDSLDEYSLERVGEWKLGKQYLPFGAGGLLRDSAPALTYHTRVAVDQLPVTLGFADSGEGRTRGFYGRVGRETGLSLATGEYLTSQPTSLTPLRHPEDAPGQGRGFGLAWGLDTRQQVGVATLTAEVVGLREGQTALDEPTVLSDLRAVWRTAKSPRVAEMRFLVGWARDWHQRQDYLRLSAEIQVDRKLVVTPYLRLKGTELTELGVSSRVRF